MKHTFLIIVCSWVVNTGFSQFFKVIEDYKFSSDFYAGSFVTDINSDGYKDILYADRKDVYLFLNKGLDKIAFDRIKLVSDNSLKKTFEVLDVDNDSDPDILLGVSGKIILLENRSTNTKTEFVKDSKDFLYFLNQSGATPTMLAEDINNDGLMDVVVAYGSTRILFQKPDKTYFNYIVPMAQYSKIVKISATDLNNDGSLDLVFGRNETTGSLGLFYCLNFNNNFPLAEAVRMDKVNDFIITDINNDTLPDIITMDYAGDRSMVIYSNTGKETGLFQTAVVQTGILNNYLSLAAGHISSQNEVSILAGFEQGVGIKLFRHNGGVPLEWTVSDLTGAAGISEKLYAFDLDNDGDDEIIQMLSDDGFVIFDNRLISFVNNMTEAGYRVYPNPCQHSVVISSEKEVKNISIVDIHGKVWLKSDTHTTKAINLDMHNIPSGLLIVEIIDSQEKINRLKLIHQEE